MNATQLLEMMQGQRIASVEAKGDAIIFVLGNPDDGEQVAIFTPILTAGVNSMGMHGSAVIPCIHLALSEKV